MAVLPIIIVLVSVGLTSTQPSAPKNVTNSTAPRDMYVVKATVYTVGILTNGTTITSNNNSGRQESVTFFRSNGSSVDLSAIPRPLLTNVTAENVVGVAPMTKILPWSALKEFTSHSQEQIHPSKKVKRDVVKTEKGSALFPKETGVQSIALPPLVALNSNMSKIPVPIPNVSVVSYAKVNTLIHEP